MAVKRKNAPAFAQYASFKKRLLSYLADSFILAIASFIVFVLLAKIMYNTKNFKTVLRGSDESIAFFYVMLLLVSIIITGYFYYVLFECSKWMATPGKKIFHLQMINQDGHKLSVYGASVRYLYRYLSYVMLLSGFLFSLIHKRRMTLHDYIAGCVCVQKEKAI